MCQITQVQLLAEQECSLRKVQTSSSVHLVSYPMDTRVHSLGVSDQDMKPRTHIHLLLMLKMNGAIHWIPSVCLNGVEKDSVTFTEQGEDSHFQGQTTPDAITTSILLQQN